MGAALETALAEAELTSVLQLAFLPLGDDHLRRVADAVATSPRVSRDDAVQVGYTPLEGSIGHIWELLYKL